MTRDPISAALAAAVAGELRPELDELRSALADLRASVERGPSPERLLSRAGCAEWLGVAVRTVDALIAEGAPVVRIGAKGGSPRFVPSELIAWLRRRGETAPPLALVKGGRK